MSDENKPVTGFPPVEEASEPAVVQGEPHVGTDLFPKEATKGKVIRVDPNADNDFNAVQASREKRFLKENALRGDIDAQIAIHMANFRPMK